jgi:MFS family permease
MKDQINVAAFTSLTNAFASIAASVWPLIIALIKDNGNWAMTYWTLAIMTAIVLLATIVLDGVVKTTYKKDNNGEILE